MDFCVPKGPMVIVAVHPVGLKGSGTIIFIQLCFYSVNNKICHFFSEFTQKERPILLLKKFYKIYQSLTKTFADPVFFLLNYKK